MPESRFSPCENWRDEAAGHQLSALSRAATAFLAPKLKKLGLRKPWLPLMLEIMENPGNTQDGLCRLLRMDKASAARNLLEMERLGYVTREEDPEDRRQKRVAPTQKLLDLAPPLHAILEEHQATLFRGFDESARKEALAYLRAMRANIETSL